MGRPAKVLGICSESYGRKLKAYERYFSRAEIQRVLFPPTYQTVERTRPLEPGDKRLWIALQIFVELRNETVFHIPFREASKVCVLFRLIYDSPDALRRTGSGTALQMCQSDLEGENQHTSISWSAIARR
jgi:hypothetical protein